MRGGCVGAAWDDGRRGPETGGGRDADGDGCPRWLGNFSGRTRAFRRHTSSASASAMAVDASRGRQEDSRPSVKAARPKAQPKCDAAAAGPQQTVFSSAVTAPSGPHDSD